MSKHVNSTEAALLWHDFFGISPTTSQCPSVQDRDFGVLNRMTGVAAAEHIHADDPGTGAKTRGVVANTHAIAAAISRGIRSGVSGRPAALPTSHQRTKSNNMATTN